MSAHADAEMAAFTHRFEMEVKAFLALSDAEKSKALCVASVLWWARGTCEDRARKTAGIARTDFYKSAAIHCAALA